MKLSLNYRSTQEILYLSNWVVNQSPLCYSKDLKSYRGHGNKTKLVYVNYVHAISWTRNLPTCCRTPTYPTRQAMEC